MEMATSIFDKQSADNSSEEIIQQVKELKRYLTEIDPNQVTDYFNFKQPSTNPEDYPESYRKNNSIEQKCLDFVYNFKQQYKRVYKERKSLILTPKNELGIKKMICTYICPVKWTYPEFITWEGCASFVSDYFNYLPLIPSTVFPNILYSSTTFIKHQNGNSFDYSILLCSLLIGSGYDAYVVSGYATREVCYSDQSRDECPDLIVKSCSKKENTVQEPCKYLVKSTKTYQSVYDLKQIAKALQSDKDKEVLDKENLEKQILESEKPKPDPLFGMRVHAWVLIKAGLKDVKTDFFIEPFTGIAVEVGDKKFLGIESVFNDSNYWFTKFYCGNGLDKISFNLDDLNNWEAIFPEIQPRYTVKDGDGVEEEITPDFFGCIVPLSWVKNLKIDKYNYERRYPQNQKLNNYYKVQQFRYSPYFCLSGLVKRLKIYDDLKYQNLIETHEFLSNRDDYHYKTILYANGTITQFFEAGNENHLKEYTFEEKYPEPENNKTILFHENGRVDGLIKRVESSFILEEYYSNRSDFLEKIYVEFLPRDLSDEKQDLICRTPTLIVKTFARNVAISADEDIKELTFKLLDNKICLVYHLEEFKDIQSIREFNKPEISNDGKYNLLFEENTHFCFKNNLTAAPETRLKVYNMLKQLLEVEKQTLEDIKMSEINSRSIIKIRIKSIRHDNLFINLYDTIRNKDAKARRINLALDDKSINSDPQSEDNQLDFLAPYISKMPSPYITDQQQAFEVREMALYDLKKKLLMQANLIKSRFEAETENLQKKQTWYYQNKMVLTYEEEQTYLRYCTKTVSLLDILEHLLMRHKQVAPHKYMELDRKIRKDPRLAKYMDH